MRINKKNGAHRRVLIPLDNRMRDGEIISDDVLKKAVVKRDAQGELRWRHLPMEGVRVATGHRRKGL